MANEQEIRKRSGSGTVPADLLAGLEGSYYTSVLDFESSTQVLRLGPMPPSPWRVVRIYNGLDRVYEPMTLDELATFIEEHKVEIPFGATLDDIAGITALSGDDIPNTFVCSPNEIELHLKTGRPYPLLPDMAAPWLFVQPEEEPVSAFRSFWRKLVDLMAGVTTLRWSRRR